MARDQAMRRFDVAGVAPVLREHELFLGRQHRESADFLQIPRQAAFGGRGWQLQICHGLTPFLAAKRG